MVTMTQQPLTFGVWLAGIIARWRLVFGVIGGSLLAAALAVIFVPPVYESHASFVTAGVLNSISPAWNFTWPPSCWPRRGGRLRLAKLRRRRSEP